MRANRVIRRGTQLDAALNLCASEGGGRLTTGRTLADRLGRWISPLSGSVATSPLNGEKTKPHYPFHVRFVISATPILRVFSRFAKLEKHVWTHSVIPH